MRLSRRTLPRRRAGEAGLAWNRPNLLSRNELSLSSPQFEDGGLLPLETASTAAGGQNLSPTLVWDPQKVSGQRLLVVVEDADAARRRPAVHCLASLDGQRFRSGRIEAGALTSGDEDEGIMLLRSTFGRGYVGPAAVRGHGLHRYVFQLFVLPMDLSPTIYGRLERRRPGKLLGEIGMPVIGRGRLTGLYDVCR